MGKFIFNATLDSRKCSLFGDLDGKIFDEKDIKPGINYPPMHEGCSYWTNEIFSKEQVREMKRKTRIARNPYTGKNEKIPYTTYNNWIKRYKKPISN